MMGGHTKPLCVQANESHNISWVENATPSKTPLMLVVQIREDVDLLSCTFNLQAS